MEDTVYTCSKCGENGFLNDFDMNNPDNACICNECYLKNPLPTKEEQKVIDEFRKTFKEVEILSPRDEMWNEDYHEYITLADGFKTDALESFLLTALRNKEKEVWGRAEECVPKEVKPVNTDDIWRTTHRQSWNACREITLKNIKNLSK